MSPVDLSTWPTVDRKTPTAKAPAAADVAAVGEAVEQVEITAPGVVLGLDQDVYLADPVKGGSLSHSGVKTLVMKTPALFAYAREHGRPNKTHFDFGHAAHREVLGIGSEIVVVQKVAKDGTASDAGDYATKSAQEHRDEIYASGGVPILASQLADVREMAAAIRRHPLASKLLAPEAGQPEASAFVQDPATGVWMRCRYDFLSEPAESGLLTLVDYKTADDASTEAFAKSAANYGYHIQDVFYTEIARLLGLADDVAFMFVAQEKNPPFLVNVIELDIIAQSIGRLHKRNALETYKACTESGIWPGYPDQEPALASLPLWYERKFEDELEMVI